MRKLISYVLSAMVLVIGFVFAHTFAPEVGGRITAAWNANSAEEMRGALVLFFGFSLVLATVFGIIAVLLWGGMTPEERRSEREKMAEVKRQRKLQRRQELLGSSHRAPLI
jgi:hypothetical protein